MRVLSDIKKLTTQLESKRWVEIDSQGSLDQTCLRNPGIYLLAYGKKLEKEQLNFKDVIYVGESQNVKVRLTRFKNAVKIKNAPGHAAATTFRDKYGPYRPSLRGRRIYFIALTLGSSATKSDPPSEELNRILVRCLERLLIAHITTETRRKPCLNKR